MNTYELNQHIARLQGIEGKPRWVATDEDLYFGEPPAGTKIPNSVLKWQNREKVSDALYKIVYKPTYPDYAAKLSEAIKLTENDWYWETQEMPQYFIASVYYYQEGEKVMYTVQVRWDSFDTREAVMAYTRCICYLLAKGEDIKPYAEIVYLFRVDHSPVTLMRLLDIEDD